MPLPTFTDLTIIDTFGVWREKINALSADVLTLSSGFVDLTSTQTITGSKTFGSGSTFKIDNATGLLLGADVNLYRSAANVLKTDDAFQATSFTASGAGSFGTTLSTGGLATLASLTVTGVTSVAAITASGASNLQQVFATTINASGNLGVTGNITLGVGSSITCPSGNITATAGLVRGNSLQSDTTLSVTGTATLSSTLSVSGASSLSTLVTSGNAIVNGSIGIGVPSPTAKLHIGGVAGIDGIKFPDGTSQVTAANTSAGFYFIDPVTYTPASSNGISNYDNLNVRSTLGISPYPKAIIVYQQYGANSSGTFRSQFRNASGYIYKFMTENSAGDSASVSSSQAIIPVNADGTIEYSAYHPLGGSRTFDIQGYIL